MTAQVVSEAGEKQRAGHVLFRFVFGFLCVFAALTLPSPGLGPTYVRAHAALGNAFVERLDFASGARLSLEARPEELLLEPWQAMLVVSNRARVPVKRVAVDLRTLGYLPTVAFIALVVATPVKSARRSIGVLLLGLAILAPLLVVLVALPLISFFGGQGPVTIFHLGRTGHVIVNVVYRALVAPPGMAYAVPLLLYWALSKIPPSAFGSGPIFTKFHPKSRRDVTSVPSEPS